MPDINVEFEVFCSCGAGLCQQSQVRYSYNRHEPQVVIEPCERCLDKAYDRGYAEGQAAAREEMETT